MTRLQAGQAVDRAQLNMRIATEEIHILRAVATAT